MNDLFAHIDRNVERGLQRLERLAAQPSVSAQNLGLAEAAELTAQTLRDYGFATVQILPTKGGRPSSTAR